MPTPLEQAAVAISNFLLSCALFFFAGKLFALPAAHFAGRFYWRWGLLMSAFSSFLAGVSHGFFEYDPQMVVFNFHLENVSWALLCAAGLTNIMAVTAIPGQLNERLRRVIRSFFVIALVISLYLMISLHFFVLVSLYYALTLLVLLAVALTLNGGYNALSYYALLFFLAAILQAAHIGLLYPINHNVLGHLVLTGGSYWAYQVGMQLVEHGDKKNRGTSG